MTIEKPEAPTADEAASESRQPVMTAESLDAIKSGFLSKLDTDLSSAGYDSGQVTPKRPLTDEERAEQPIYRAELDDLARENFLLRKAIENPEAAGLLGNLWSEDDAENQWRAAMQFVEKVKASVAPAEPDLEAQVPETLPINPASNPRSPSSGGMSDQIADPEWRKAFLRNMGEHWPSR